jgi:HlyD family secretion protein
MTPTRIVIYRDKPKPTPPRWLLPVMLFGLSTCSAPAPTNSAAANPPADAPRSVSVTRVVVRAGDIGFSASGLLVPHEVFAATSDVPGIAVVRVAVHEGAFVARGQILAHLDDTLIRSQLAQQTAVIAQQQVLIRQAQAEAARAQPMAGAGVLSDEAVQGRGFKADTALAQLRVQQAQLRDLQTRAARLMVRAPVAGRVIDRNVKIGDISGSPVPMFTIVPGGTMELQVQMPENRLADLAIGAAADVTLAEGQKLVGRVVTLGTRIDQQSALGAVRLSLAPPAGQPWPVLRPGASGTARFVGRTQAQRAVPEAAVQYDTAGASVVVLGRDDRVRRVAVRTGARGGGFVELIAGPSAGTPILAVSAAFVAEGDRVTPVFAHAPAPR